MRTVLFMNPLTNPLFKSLALLLVVLFGGAAIALQARGLLRRFVMIGGSVSVAATPGRVLWARYRTWIIIAFLFAGAVLSGPLAVAGLCASLCWQGEREYARLTGLPRLHLFALILGGWITLAATLLLGPVALMYAPVLAFFGWSALALSPVPGEMEVGKRFLGALTGLWGYLYLGWLPAYLVALSVGKAPGLVLAVGLGVAMSDVGAFCAGKMLRGPKLAPQLSPAKTWGGVLGNVLGAALALLLIPFALPPLEWGQRVALLLVIGLGSVWGDLLESLLKRQSGVKDAGGLLPGFGGLLDRIDSLLLVAPLVYYLSLVILR